MLEYLSIPQSLHIEHLKSVAFELAEDFSFGIYDSNLVLSSKIHYPDHNLYEQLGRFYIIWVFELSNGLKLKEQFVYGTKSWDRFIAPSNVLDEKLVFYKNNSFHAYLSEETPFYKEQELLELQTLQSNIGILSLVETGHTFNITQIILLNKTTENAADLGYLNHLGPTNNLSKVCPQYRLSKATSILDYIRMKGFDGAEKDLKIEQIVDFSEERLLIAVFYRRYKKNPATSTNKNSPFFYLFIDKQSGGVVGFLNFVKDLKPFKSTHFFGLEDSPYPEDNFNVFPFGNGLVYKSSKNLIFFDANGKIERKISLSNKKIPDIRASKLIGSKNNSLYFLHLKKGLVFEMINNPDLEDKLEDLNKELKKNPNRAVLIEEQHLDAQNLWIKIDA